jgi:hypothetical protein
MKATTWATLLATAGMVLAAPRCSMGAERLGADGWRVKVHGRDKTWTTTGHVPCGGLQLLKDK